MSVWKIQYDNFLLKKYFDRIISSRSYFRSQFTISTSRLIQYEKDFIPHHFKMMKKNHHFNFQMRLHLLRTKFRKNILFKNCSDFINDTIIFLLRRTHLSLARQKLQYFMGQWNLKIFKKTVFICKWGLHVWRVKQRIRWNKNSSFLKFVFLAKYFGIDQDMWI